MKVEEEKFYEMRNQSGSRSFSGSEGRCTRSQVAPDWTLTESLILVNEIAAVEADCQKALSSFQKWKIISENCNALEVPRNFNHCRRKWDSLLHDFNKIKEWESRSGARSYWSLDDVKAKKSGLPENFDNELFKSIDNLVRLREDRCDTDPESDPEDEPDLPVGLTETGSKRKRRRAKCHRDRAEKNEEQILEEPLSMLAEKKLSKGSFIEKFRKSNSGKRLLENHTGKMLSQLEEKPQLKFEPDNTPEVSLEEVHLKCLLETKLHKDNAQKRPQKVHDEEEVISNDEMEETMTMKLEETAEKILTIVSETAEHKADNLKNGKDCQPEFARHQGDKLIAYLGEIAHTLNQLCAVVHEHK